MLENEFINRSNGGPALSTAHTRRAVLAGLALATALPFGGALAADPVTARVGYIPVIGAAPIFVADRDGKLAEKGVKLVFTTYDSGPNAIQALASGTIDVYVAGVAPLAVARSKGIDIRVVAATAVGENVLVVGPGLATVFKPGVSAAEALAAHAKAKGKPVRLATQPAGSVPNTTLQYWLWKIAKAAKTDVEIVPLGIDATQQAILADAVDGAIVREPALTIVTERNPGIRLVATGNELFPGQPGTVVAVTGAFLEKNPAAVQAIVDGLVEAEKILTATPEKAAPYVGAALGKGLVDPALITKALKSPATRFEIDPRKIVEPARAQQAFQVEIGSLEKELPFDGLFEPRFFEAATEK